MQPVKGVDDIFRKIRRTVESLRVKKLHVVRIECIGQHEVTAASRRAAIAWNIFGLADFAVAITLGLITSPGRFQLIVPNVLSIGAGAYPDVLTPAFVVPSSILLHALSLRQLIRRRAA
jgi:non-canonical (house-cleaning) NTP pyrophosphatase